MTGSKNSTSSTKFVFLDWSEKQDGRPGLWLAEIFWLLSWNCRTESNETWQETRSQYPLPSLCFWADWKKTRWLPRPLIGWDIFDFSFETAQQNAMKLDRKQNLNILYPVCVFSGWWKINDGRPGLWLDDTFSNSPLKPLNGIQRHLKGSKISTSSIKLVFFGLREKPWRASWPLIGWHIFEFSSETAEQNSRKLDKKQDRNILYHVCDFWANQTNSMAVLASDWLRQFQLIWNRWTELIEIWQE